MGADFRRAVPLPALLPRLGFDLKGPQDERGPWRRRQRGSSRQEVARPWPVSRRDERKAAAPNSFFRARPSLPLCSARLVCAPHIFHTRWPLW